MPFFPPVVHSEKHKKIKLGCDSLQVQKPKKYKEKIKKNKCVPGKKGIFIYLQRKHYFGSCYCYNNFYVGNSFGDKLHNSS